MTELTVVLYGEERNAFDLLRLRANQLDALTTLCAESFSSLDTSYHDYALSALRDMAFEIRQLADAINDSQPSTTEAE